MKEIYLKVFFGGDEDNNYKIIQYVKCKLNPSIGTGVMVDSFQRIVGFVNNVLFTDTIKEIENNPQIAEFGYGKIDRKDIPKNILNILDNNYIELK